MIVNGRQSFFNYDFSIISNINLNKCILSNSLSGHLLSYRAQTTTNQNASRCSVAISFIKSNGNNSYIESASDKLGSHESGRADDSGLFRDCSDSERSFTSCIKSSSFDCCKRKIEHRNSMLYFLCIKKSLFMRDFNVVRKLIDKRTKFRINTQAGEQHGIVLLPFS